jgi:poly-gamma-glutamate synthesis protein (capsule biosynthesis protein)
LVTDYAVDPVYRNDRQLLFEVTLRGGSPRRVRALPIELDYARTRPASGSAREWIASRFVDLCGHVGSRVVPEDEWLGVLPMGGDSPR